MWLYDICMDLILSWSHYVLGLDVDPGVDTDRHIHLLLHMADTNLRVVTNMKQPCVVIFMRMMYMVFRGSSLRFVFAYMFLFQILPI